MYETADRSPEKLTYTGLYWTSLKLVLKEGGAGLQQHLVLPAQPMSGAPQHRRGLPSGQCRWGETFGNSKGSLY